jgi:hypothetical protein
MARKYSVYSNTASQTTPIPVPTGLTLTLISGGVKYDWTDNSGGVAETEVWCRNDSDAYTTVTYTINAGIVTKSETALAVDLRYCKIRSKHGTNYSAFTAESSIAMLSAELIGAWATAAYWNTEFSAAWSADNTKLSCNDASTSRIRRATWWTSGATYRTIVTITGTGVFRPPYANIANQATVNAPGTFTNYVIPNAVTLCMQSVTAFVGDVTAVSIKKVLVP